MPPGYRCQAQSRRPDSEDSWESRHWCNRNTAPPQPAQTTTRPATGQNQMRAEYRTRSRAPFHQADHDGSHAPGHGCWTETRWKSSARAQLPEQATRPSAESFSARRPVYGYGCSSTWARNSQTLGCYSQKPDWPGVVELISVVSNC